LTQQLALYQTILTSEKSFLSSSQSEVINHVRQALGAVGYTYAYNAEELSFSAIAKTNTNQAHYITVNNLGANGISAQINTLYNDKSANAETVVRAENNKLLRALGGYDTLK
ncbi:MAG: hypothetical protein LBD99_02795, partial [Candidatus Margulisbacteria bacterium]|nr:hypothetical protein [Candidatus Margulisiibacteriota bacterium]